MTESALNREWVALSAAWTKEAREGRNANRNGLLDPPMLAACGEVRGLWALDCGCGEGRFCRKLAERGAAHVLGIDLCEPMIDAARELHGESDHYRVADVQELNFIGDETFDLVISYLNQCDLVDFEANNREVFRVLKSGGRFIIANLHPMRSAVGHWQRTEDGTKEHIVLDRYFEERERHWRMMGVDFTNFHRSLETYVSSFLATGFSITGIIEPTVTPANLERYPELDDELRVPNFIIYCLQKA
ncbi:MAG: class I SAM-dependent methyltransferase [Lentisphaerae bacterium]|nr:class I SAM-dependent methyltransferase [Lentisphaerota bacterium]MBT4822609.1 class I SAM-dependent methyltransferase [Lentisphaerota bacterium]MBT5610909.1 class I SAM-dependent methyltransferase [Lentisphaerota bacterium]MBT7055906.1 class I SAM-dependent methyltransferase [Lentisphaerota bacterium]MBT7846699.1 class I SAM-dependent methyltransferase [Lentisphaerota bacterium]